MPTNKNNLIMLNALDEQKTSTNKTYDEGNAIILQKLEEKIFIKNNQLNRLNGHSRHIKKI